MVNQFIKALLLVSLTSSLCYADTLLIKNAKIHTLGAQGTINKASILIIDGKVSTIGTDIPNQDNYTVIDASNKVITPGLMHASTNLGLKEISAVDSTVDYEATDEDYPVFLSIAEVINPNSSLFAHNRINGLTRAMVVPESEKSLFSGVGSLIKLSSDMAPVLLVDNAVYLKYGAAAAEMSGGSRAYALALIKEIITDVQTYMKKAKDFKAESKLKTRDIKALIPLLKGEIPLVVSVHQASDILTMLKLQKRYSLKMILSGAEEAWKVSAQIAAANVAVMIDPYRNAPETFEMISNRIDSATLLHKAGVEIILADQSMNRTHNAYTLRYTAGNAVAYGLPWDAALAAITSTPAKWFGIGNSYGTLETGMDADIVIWDGDPLEITTSAEQVFIQGKKIAMVSRQTRLRDRYLNKGDRPAGYSK